MKISTRSGLVGFLLALSTINIPTANAADNSALPPTIENRISRITAAMKQRQDQIQETSNLEPERIAGGWVDTKKGGDWIDGNKRGWGDASNGNGWYDGKKTGWVDGHGGGFANVNPWRSGGSDKNHR